MIPQKGHVDKKMDVKKNDMSIHDGFLTLYRGPY